jgi:hypothetical protein
LSLAQPRYVQGDADALAVAELDVAELTELGLDRLVVTELELAEDAWLLVVDCVELDVEVVVWLLESWFELVDCVELEELEEIWLELDDVAELEVLKELDELEAVCVELELESLELELLEIWLELDD